MSTESSALHAASPSSLNVINYSIVIAYIVNVAFTYGLGVLGWFGASTNSELSAKYQTLVTPAGWAFAIWSIIFLSELVFCVVQLFPKYRSTGWVQEIVRYNYVGVCLAQVSWTLFFSFEHIFLSLLAMLALLVFLLRIVIVGLKRQEHNDSSCGSNYWLLQFPFLIHSGWIVAATLVNINVVLVDFQASSTLQVVAAVISLVALVVACLVALFTNRAKPEFVIPVVLVWASLGIWKELGDPNDLILNTFSNSTIGTVRFGAFVAFLVNCQLIGLALFQIFWRRRGAIGEEEAVYLRTGDNGNVAST